MAKKKNTVLTLDPFPPLEWDKYFWVSTMKLHAWKGFQSRGGSYGSSSSRKKSDDTVRFNVNNPFGKKEIPPTVEQVEAFRDLVANQEVIRNSILEEIFREYPSYQKIYFDEFAIEESEQTLPVLDRPARLNRVLGLAGIHILPVSKDGIAYVGYEFGCAWDEEHGAGVMMHCSRVVSSGHADTSFLVWIAEADAKSPRKKRK